MRAIPLPAHRFELTSAQMGMWLGTRFASRDTNFNLAEAIDIRGPFSPDRFLQALQSLCREADTIRLRVADTPEGPRQWIDPEFSGSVPVLDFRGEADPEAAAEQWMAQDCARQVDVVQGPLWFSALLQLGPERHIWYQRGHHFAFDGFAGVVLARRAADLYTALVEGTPPPAASELAPLSALIDEDRAYRGSERARRDREYWMERFQDRPAPLSLADRRSANVGGLLRSTAHWPAAQVAAARGTAQQHGGTFPQFLIAATAAYLYRMTGVSDLVIGVPVTARYNDRMRRAPGMVANALPLRLAMRPDLLFIDLLREVGRQMRQVLRHQAYRYEHLREDLELLANNQQLFTTVINVEPFDYDLRFGDCPAAFRNLTNGTAQDLGIFMYECGNGQDLQIDFDANPALYTGPELAAHQRRLLGLLDRLAHEPAQAIGRLDVLPPHERQTLLSGWNDTAHAQPEAHLAQLIDEGLSRDAGAVALRFEGRSMTRAELDLRAAAWARRLTAMGAGPKRIVALAIPRSLELVVALVAVLRSGAAYLPIDPDFPPDRLAFMLEDAQPVCLMTCGELSERFDARIPRFITDGPEAEGVAEAPLRTGLQPSHPAYVIYTSGSTGQPKGVVVPHSAIANRLRWMQAEYALQADDRVLQKTPSSFDVSVWEFFWPLISGATLVVARPGGHRDTGYLAGLIAQEAVTTVHFVPSMLDVFLRDPAAAACTTLRRVICSGEALPAPLAAQFHQTFDCGLHNLYGPTEAAVDVTAWACGPQDGAGLARIPIGRPIWNTQMYVLDPGLQPLPVGVTGELYIAGDGLARGYLNRPVLTAERFIANPHGPAGSRMYRTGDLARWRADGSLDFLGRSDHQVKIRGLRIEPGEIEATLLRHPAVLQAAVVVHEDAHAGKLLVAYYVPADGAPLDSFALKAHVAQHVPDYMVPSAFVALDSLPLGPTGKLDRRALPAPLAPTARNTYTAPRSAAEQTLAELWARALKVEQVGIHDNFFELGGHSLMAIQLGMQVRERLHPEFPPAELYNRPTIAELAAWIENNGGERPPVDLQAETVLPDHIRGREGAAPPVTAQRVFLTGASGFVGSYLLATLLRETTASVVCHVRAADEAAGARKIRRALEERHLADAWDGARVEVVTGDLGAPQLGVTDEAMQRICGECDAIYHCAAQVDYLHPYESLKPSNVDSVVTLLEWTQRGRPKVMHYVSTLGVIGLDPETPVVTEQAPLATPAGLVGGYAQSKWVADRLARAAQARGLPVAIYRLGSITGDNVHAACNQADVFWRVAQLYVDLEMYPDLDLPLNLTPVDDVARAVVRLSRQQESWGRIFHLLGSEPLHVGDVRDVFQQIGRPLQPTDLDTWLHHAHMRLAMTQDQDLAALLAILGAYDTDAVPPILCGAATQARLQALGAPIQSVDRQLLRRYFENLGFGVTETAGQRPAAALA
ncbi:non-ribosomal peptide synthetase [Paracidovorax konjaci]|uniref:Amino acid adenylation domain-containing protein/thioester reductase domain-containing protein n=1 Tax=Paracidovorax konjaci TaxID=32040 RepID=A0A1I1W5X7_9BURK|nr:non-ribosomal peptide synthetase [Paracidovorax konjaci]SFD90409.1 amino acid adenylation domain-containing protein/thioester reductase domain-containing protein [Paracidovorax konjaci]